MNKANIQQFEFLIGYMKSVQKEHPKATVYYDFESREVRITYPLPKDFERLKEINFKIKKTDI